MPEPLQLPEPSTEQLVHAPLQLVVCQVRHDRNLAVGDAARVLAIRDALAAAFGESLQVEEHAQQEVGLTLGPGGMAPITSQESQRGWRLRSRDGRWIVALLPDFFALESTGYTSWSDFRTRLDVLAAAVADHLGPALQMRLGLRYVDRIAMPRASEPTEWQGHIDDSLLGVVLHPAFGRSLSVAQQVVQLEGPGGTRVLLRHGTQFDEQERAWPYTLDTDCFDDQSREFEAGEVGRGAHQLHTIALQVFQASVTDRLLALLADRVER